MDNIFLFDIESGKIIRVIGDAVPAIYYQKMKLPTKVQIVNAIRIESSDSEQDIVELKRFVEKFKTVDDAIIRIKYNISRVAQRVPLYDMRTQNMYIFAGTDLYQRIAQNNHRFPTRQLLKFLSNERSNMAQKLIDNSVVDALFTRTLRKLDLIFDFINQLDMTEMYKTFVRLMYESTPILGGEVSTCVRPSYTPYLPHLKPYYTTSEITNLALNMDLIGPDSVVNTEELCEKVRSNDVSWKILVQHHKYIADADRIGLIQYYTVQGSSVMNTYLRGLTEHNYHDIDLERQIIAMNDLIREAPAFDKSYIFYRFVSTDQFLKHLKVQDIHTEAAFTSTTRNPFYNTGSYTFGSVLMKIRVPANIKGVALSVETFTHFPNEQEIIFPARSKFRLISKHKHTRFYHTDPGVTINVKKKYEFEFIGVDDLSFESRVTYTRPLPVISYLDLVDSDEHKKLRFADKIRIFTNKYVSPMGKFLAKIGNAEFSTMVDRYDSTGPYKNFYALTTDNGLSMYSFYEGYLLFMFEYGYVRDHVEMHINYHTKYNRLVRGKIMSDNDFIMFISSLANYFHVDVTTLYADYMACTSMKKSGEGDEVEFVGGNYCVDFYNYLKHANKRYEGGQVLAIEVTPKYSTYDLDLLHNTGVMTILRDTDQDELYQVYKKTYIVDGGVDTIAAYYIWLVDNKCYLADLFVDKFKRFYPEDSNPFNSDMYSIDANVFLYNRNLVCAISRRYFRGRTCRNL